MTQIETLIKIAKSQIGTKEMPAGSNKVKYNSWYYGREVSGENYAWCSTFVLWCFNEGKLMSLTPFVTLAAAKKAYAEGAYKWVQNGGNVINSPKEVKEGDIVCYTFSHVGICSEASKNGTFKAIEGNTDVAGGRTGGQVLEKTRKLTEVKAIFRPKYEEVKEEIKQETKEDEMTYNNISEVPEWGKFVADLDVRKGKLQFPITESLLRARIAAYRDYKEMGLINSQTLEPLATR